MGDDQKQFEEIRLLWDGSPTDKKLDYLFDAIGAVYKRLDNFHLEVSKKAKEIDSRCEDRRSSCAQSVADRGKVYITRAQARLFVVGILILGTGIAIGLGLLTYKEFFGVVKAVL